jgi:hypothetical protein
MVDKLEAIIGWMLLGTAIITLWAVLTPYHAFVG